MVRIERLRRLDASSGEVWRVLADFGRISAWAPNVDHSCLLTAQSGEVGATRRIQAGRTVVRETIVAWEPETSLSYTLTGLPRAVRSATNTWVLRPADSPESTEVTVVSEADLGPRPPQRLAARVVARVLASASEQMLSGLSAHLDAPTRSGR